MALTPAEKMRRYRQKIKNDPKKYEEVKKKDLQRIKMKRKKVLELNPQQKNKIRQQWREQKRRQRSNEQKYKYNKTKPTPTLNTDQNVEKGHDSDMNGAFKLRYLQKRCKTLTRTLKAEKERVQKLITVQEKLRKRIYRQKVNSEKTIASLKTTINKMKAREEILEASLKTTYKNCVKHTEKRIFKSLVANAGRKTYVAKLLGLSGRARIAKKRPHISTNPEIKSYFLRDDVSRCTAGKKECRTKNKEKCQIRYLLDTLQNLYEKYKSEGGRFKFTTFRKYKPFYVLAPHLGSRKTCLCIKHDNIELKFKELRKLGVISQPTLKEVLKDVSCDLKSHLCMYSKCSTCRDIHLQHNATNETLNKTVAWMKWERKTHEYTKKEGPENKRLTTTKTSKETKSSTLTELLKLFESDLKLFKKHYYNVNHQQEKYQTGVTDLKDNEALIICDFSQNYEPKMYEEVQSAHYVKEQVSLHTGMIYLKNKSHSFCTISPSSVHQPQAIWAHLRPILKFIKMQYPQISVIHFYSDGPTSQYRQKHNFYLLSAFTQRFGFDYCTWSFFESGHGKGVADGIGGTVKRALDRKVCFGRDVCNAVDAFSVLTDCMRTVKVWYISEEDIKDVASLLPQNLPTLVGTMQVHQIITKDFGSVLYRDLGCFCGEQRGLCCCFNPKIHNFGTNTMSLSGNEHFIDKEVDEAVSDNGARSRNESLLLHKDFSHSMDVDLPENDTVMEIDTVNENLPHDDDARVKKTIIKNAPHYRSLTDGMNVESINLHDQDLNEEIIFNLPVIHDADELLTSNASALCDFSFHDRKSVDMISNEVQKHLSKNRNFKTEGSPSRVTVDLTLSEENPEDSHSAEKIDLNLIMSPALKANLSDVVITCPVVSGSLFIKYDMSVCLETVVDKKEARRQPKADEMDITLSKNGAVINDADEIFDYISSDDSKSVHMKPKKKQKRKPIKQIKTKVNPSLVTVDLTLTEENKEGSDKAKKKDLRSSKVTDKRTTRKQSKSLRTIVKRSFKCSSCSGPLVFNCIAKCMSCSNNFCWDCCGGQIIRDYLCDKCLNDEETD